MVGKHLLVQKLAVSSAVADVTPRGERKRRRAARRDKAGVAWHSAGGGERRGPARAPAPRAAPRASCQSPADSACACVTRAAPCTALVLRTRRVPPRCGREPRPLPYRRNVSPDLRVTCYDLTFERLRSLTRLVYPLTM
ncbi:hypothetical protein RR48_08049 [Papilio machaon]|uniref:Uncharacterized protein n=1 Tax=Papilio machaon TaxID=76193 RepID=A0A194R1T2_PAPMA|nr:hypothetical protein RR48_08049 [Papilio machaon]